MSAKQNEVSRESMQILYGLQSDRAQTIVTNVQPTKSIDTQFKFDVITNEDGRCVVVIQPNYLQSKTMRSNILDEFRLVTAFYANDPGIHDDFTGDYPFYGLETTNEYIDEKDIDFDFDGYHCMKSVVSKLGSPKIVGEPVKPSEQPQQCNDDNVYITIEKVNARMIPHLIHKNSIKEYVTKLPLYLTSNYMSNKILFKAQYKVTVDQGLDFRGIDTNLDYITYENDGMYAEQPIVIVNEFNEQGVIPITRAGQFLKPNVEEYSKWVIGDNSTFEPDVDKILGMNRTLVFGSKFMQNSLSQPQQYETIPKVQDFLIVIKVNAPPRTRITFGVRNYYQVIRTTDQMVNSVDDKAHRQLTFTEQEKKQFAAHLVLSQGLGCASTTAIRDQVKEIANYLSTTNSTFSSYCQANGNWFTNALSSVWDCTSGVLIDAGMAAIDSVFESIFSLFS